MTPEPNSMRGKRAIEKLSISNVDNWIEALAYNAMAWFCHPICDRIAPGQIMLSFFMCYGILFCFIGFIKKISLDLQQIEEYQSANCLVQGSNFRDLIGKPL